MPPYYEERRLLAGCVAFPLGFSFNWILSCVVKMKRKTRDAPDTENRLKRDVLSLSVKLNIHQIDIDTTGFCRLNT